jgi:hypothetical protein
MRYLLLVSVVLFGASWVAAQSDSGQGNQTMRSGAGTEMSVQGCLRGSGGSYTLTDANGNTFQVTGDTAKLSEHVGHEVKVSGTASSASPSPSGASGGTMGQAGSTPQQAIEVSSVKHISKTCKNGGTAR